MSASLFALALFACSDNGTACERLQTPVETFATHTQCAAQLDDALDSDAARKADAPTIYAQCLTTRQMAAVGRGTIDLTKVNVKMSRGRLATAD